MIFLPPLITDQLPCPTQPVMKNYGAMTIYDVFIELGINDAPPQKGRGSAIFLHLEKNNYQPTLGCIAISRASMDFLLRHVRPDTHICIDQWG